MAFQMQYDKDMKLSRLQHDMKNDEGLAGSVTGIGHSDEFTLANFDEGDPPEGKLLLVDLDAADNAVDDEKLICKGEVWVSGELTNVGAYRAEA